MSALTTLFTNIANAIRAKTGSSATITASDFPTEIANIESYQTYMGNTTIPNYQNAIAHIITKIPTLTLPSTSKNLSQAFAYCQNLSTIDISNWDTSAVTNMSQMFYYCTNLSSLNLGQNFSTASVTGSGLSNMFYHCYNLTSLNLSTFNTTNVTNLQNTFGEMPGLTSLDLSSFNTANVTTFYGMFTGDNNLASLTLSNSFSCAKATNVRYMFSSCRKLASITGGCLLNLGQGYTSTTANYTNYTLDLHYTILDHDSLMLIINGLYDLAAAGKPQQTLQLGSTLQAKLSAAEIAVATNKGWNVT